MTMPRFSAEAALYKTSGHYRTGRYAIHLPAQTISLIHPAMEVIEVHGCAPGSYLVGYDDGTWECAVNPDPWGGGGGGPGTPGVPSGGGGGGGGGGKPPKKRPKRPPRPAKKPTGPHNHQDNCTDAQYSSERAGPCHKARDLDMENVPFENWHYLVCEGSTMDCCQNHGDDITICDEL